jgi:WS/DGAT/MGAT family acyltransferase
MPHYAADRLSAEDASYLFFESPGAHMHLAWTWVFEGGSLVAADGGVDIAAIRRHVAARLVRFPHFRQRLVWTPVEGHPVWVDDESFKLPYHVRHVALPDPGDEARLKIMTAAIVSQPLDRSRPLWELWVVEGLAGGRFAIVAKTHHCMADGRSTVNLMTGLLDTTPRVHDDEPSDWLPRPAPGAALLVRDGLVERATHAARILADGAEALGRPARWLGAARFAGEVLQAAARRPERAPFNQPIGPHRLVNWTAVRLAPLRALAAALDANTQDVALAAVAGGLTKFLARTGVHIPGGRLRVVVPLARRDGDADDLGNRTMAGVVALPIGTEPPRQRVRTIARATTAARGDAARLGNFDVPLRVLGLGGRQTLALGLAVRRRLFACNLVVTDVAGPPAPVYLRDARLVETYPFVPLLDDQGLGLGVAAYDETCFVGLVADWEIVPNLAQLTDDVRAAFDELARA